MKAPQKPLPPPVPGQIQVQIDDSIADGSYANWANIVFSPAEFVFDFGRLMPNKPSVRVHTRIITSPDHAKRLAEVLERSLKNYEEKHGEIRRVEGDHKKVGF